MHNIRQHRIAENIAAILVELGLADQHTQIPFDTNFDETAERTATWLMEFMPDPNLSPASILQPRFPEQYKELVMVTNISFTALCAHHMLPFRGTAAVGYIPEDEIVGLSKLARLVHFFAHRLTLQERITAQIADALQDTLNPKGTAVVITAAHDCMSIRGVMEPNARTTTSAMRGCFLTDAPARQEFLHLCA